MDENKILLVDDDVPFCELLSDYLRGEGFVVTCEHDGSAGLAAIKNEEVDVIILDVMMPKMSGLDVLRDMRAFCDTPTLMLTARGEDIDRIVGLEMGADDYVSKPCNPREIVARLRAILRRSAASNVPEKPLDLTIDNVRLCSNERSVSVNTEPVELTSTEFDVLEILMRDAGQVVTKGQVSELALKRKLGPYDRSIDMHVSRLRRKLGNNVDGSERIKTVRGTGYLYVKRKDAEPR